MKKLFLAAILLLLSANLSFAIYVEEKIPIKIRPIDPITTTYDQVEVGDNIRFSVVDDVYVNDKLFITQDTEMYGIVDFVKENGWFGDNAEVEFRVFKVRNAQGKLTTFSSELSLDGFNTLRWYNPKWKRFFNYCSLIFRGNEVDIHPDANPVFNIWFTTRK